MISRAFLRGRFIPVLKHHQHHHQHHQQEHKLPKYTLKNLQPAKPKDMSSCLQQKRFFRSTENRWEMPKTPDLIYMPHVVRWMKSKLRFKYLQRMWDPEFSEGAFIYGTTQAICRMTQIISGGNLEDLAGLTTVSARLKLQQEVSHLLSPVQKQLILLKPADIKILVPINVHFVNEGARKICKVILRVLALKWHEQSPDNYKLVLVALQTEFARDYSENAPEEWIVSQFTVLECTMLTEATAKS